MTIEVTLEDFQRACSKSGPSVNNNRYCTECVVAEAAIRTLNTDILDVVSNGLIRIWKDRRFNLVSKFLHPIGTQARQLIIMFDRNWAKERPWSAENLYHEAARLNLLKLEYA